MTQYRPEADLFLFFVSDPPASGAPAGRRFKSDITTAAVDREGRHFNNDGPNSPQGYRPRHGSPNQRLAERPRRARPKPAASPASTVVWTHVVPMRVEPARVPPVFPTQDVRWAEFPTSKPKRLALSDRRRLATPADISAFLPLKRYETRAPRVLLEEPILPPLKVALTQRSLSTTSTSAWWKELAGNTFSPSQETAWRMPPRLLAAASVAAIVSIAASHIPSGAITTNDLAAATTTTAPSRTDTSAMQAASRSFVRASVATPSTMAPTTTTTTAAPTTTTTAAPKRVTSPTIPSTYASCSTSKAAAKACWWDLLDQYNWDTQTAFNIMWCESRGNPYAKNPRSTATGLFQILGGTTDPIANVRQAHTMWTKRGWQPWVCKG